MPDDTPEQRIAELKARCAELERELLTERVLHHERVRQLEAEVTRLRSLAAELR